MSSPSSTLTSGDPSRGILLIEEYGALAVAISSALHKFAPLHKIRVAHDFAEAERLAATMRPELFVLDLDPPPLGELQFFQKLKTEYPDSRALVIAAGTSAELRAERGTAGAIQFIEKPFDLPEFGAAVQALVGPWNGPLGEARGTLRDLDLIDLIQMKCLTLSSSILRIQAGGRHGTIHFHNGQISHATTETRRGVQALAQIAAWPEGEFKEEELFEGAPQTIEGNWPELLLPIVRRSAREAKRSSTAEVAALASEPKSGNRILVIDDTEMLLVFVADVLATHDSTLQILTAQTGAEGLRLARSEHPDLVLLDYSLTDTTGDRVCAALLAEEATARIPVLMMSGHPTELARTAEDYANVVAALPKPFLSGALVQAVEKALAGGPLGAVVPIQSAPKPPPAPKAPAPLHNGDAPTTNGAEEKTNPSEGAVKASPVPATQGEAAAATGSESFPAIEGVATSALFVRGARVNLIFSFEVVALELTPLLETASTRLELMTPFVVAEIPVEPGFKTEFRLGPVELDHGGAISTLRLLPTREQVPLPAPANSFAIGEVNLETTKHHLVLEAGPQRSMRVRLVAPFQIAAIELSPQFEVAALLLRASGMEVRLYNRAHDAGIGFQLQEIELTSARELHRVVVKPI